MPAIELLKLPVTAFREMAKTTSRTTKSKDQSSQPVSQQGHTRQVTAVPHRYMAKWHASVSLHSLKRTKTMRKFKPREKSKYMYGTKTIKLCGAVKWNLEFRV